MNRYSLLLLTRLVAASIVTPTDRNYGSIPDRSMYPPLDGVADYDDRSNNNDHFNNGGTNPNAKNFGYSRVPPAPPPPPPPRSSWKWWRYHALSDKEILDQLLHQQRYDRRERPPIDGTLHVNVTVSIFSINSVAKSRQEIDFVLQQEWFDARLIHENRPGGANAYLNGIHHHRDLWLPDTYFVKRGTFSEPVINPANVAIHIFTNGSVEYILRRTLDLECQINREFYPFGLQKCSFALESASYAQNEVTLVWSADALRVSVMPKLKGFSTFSCSNQQKWRGNYSCLQVDLEVEKSLADVWTRHYCPDLMLCITSLMSFGLGPSSSRLLLSLSTLLTYLVLMTTGLRHSDLESKDTDEWSALDIWSQTSLAFIFLTFLEVVLVISIGGVDKNSNQDKNKKKIVSHSSSGNPLGCGAIIQGKCDCCHYNSVDGSHPNVSLLLDGEVCLRCTSGIRSLDLSETAIDDRLTFPNVFERRDNFHQLKSRPIPATSVPTKRNFKTIFDRFCGFTFIISYMSFLAIYFCKYFS